MDEKNTEIEPRSGREASDSSALLGCHHCKLEKECHFPMRPLRPGRCNGDKFWTLEQRAQYDSDMVDEREAEIRAQIMPEWSSAS